jgi:hypothetical protein
MTQPHIENLKPFKKGQSGNPAGRPKGAKNWSTVIRELLEDPNYEIKFKDGTSRKYPALVVADTMTRKAASGDVSAATWLAKYGYGDKVDVTSAGEQLAAPQVYLPERKSEQ